MKSVVYILCLASLFSCTARESPKPEVLIPAYENLTLTEGDIASIISALESKGWKFGFLEIHRFQSRTDMVMVYGEPDKNTMHTGLGSVLQKKGGEWHLLSEEATRNQ